MLDPHGPGAPSSVSAFCKVKTDWQRELLQSVHSKIEACPKRPKVATRKPTFERAGVLIPFIKLASQPQKKNLGWHELPSHLADRQIGSQLSVHCPSIVALKSFPRRKSTALQIAENLTISETKTNLNRQSVQANGSTNSRADWST